MSQCGPLLLTPLVVALVACGGETARPDGGDELAAHGGRVCPAVQPQGSDPGSGFGTEEPAADPPPEPEPARAWICRYDAVAVGPSGDGGTRFDWERAGAPRPVGRGALPDLRQLVAGLEPRDPTACDDDLGWRWLLVLADDGGDLTGVAVDDFGCDVVRMSDEPFTNPPGEAAQAGTVAGVLGGPDDLLRTLRSLYGG